MRIALHRCFQRLSRVVLLSLTASSLLVAGCATESMSRDETLNWSADRLYAEAKDEMASSNWAAAVRLLSRLESRYPFGRHAQQAQLDTAYAHWKENETALALSAIDRFLKQYPNHERADYALYLRGLGNVNDQTSLFTAFTGEDVAERDPKAAREAFDNFKELVTRFPNSEYVEDSKARMNYLVNMLASSDIHIARFYMRRGATLAAVNRAQAVVKQYQDVPAIEEALAIMMVGYERLGLDALSKDARRVLEKNFPDSNFLKVAYDPNRRAQKQAKPEKPSVWSTTLSRLKLW